MKSVDFRIISRIYGLGRGAVIVPSDFLDIGSRQAVDLALHRLVKKGIIRRLARGLYDYPKTHPVMGILSPDPDVIARALAWVGTHLRAIAQGNSWIMRKPKNCILPVIANVS